MDKITQVKLCHKVYFCPFRKMLNSFDSFRDKYRTFRTFGQNRPLQTRPYLLLLMAFEMDALCCCSERCLCYLKSSDVDVICCRFSWNGAMSEWMQRWNYIHLIIWKYYCYAKRWKYLWIGKDEYMIPFVINIKYSKYISNMINGCIWFITFSLFEGSFSACSDLLWTLLSGLLLLFVCSGGLRNKDLLRYKGESSFSDDSDLVQLSKLETILPEFFTASPFSHKPSKEVPFMKCNVPSPFILSLVKFPMYFTPLL